MHIVNARSPVPGAQMVHLTAQVLCVIGERNAEGSRIVDIVNATGLERATVNRIARALCAAGLAECEHDGRRYHLGPLTFELGISAAQRFPLRDLAAASLDRVAHETGDTCFLMVRSGPDAVCIDRREGTFPVRALTIEIGNRRPLGAAAASVALLMHMPPAECADYLHANATRIKRYGMLDEAAVAHMVARARRLGYALNHDNIIPEVSAVGVAIPARMGQPYAALSVAALTSRIMTDQRDQKIVALLHAEAQVIAAALQPPALPPAADEPTPERG